MVIYSHSKLSIFEQCKKKYKLKYIDKIPPEIEQTIEGYLGEKVHETLEWIYINRMQDILVSLDEAIEYYISSWNKDYSNEIKIVNIENPPELYFNKGVKFIIDYFTKHHPFLDNTIALEKKVYVTLDSEGKYVLQGYIDRLVHDKERNIFEVHDYKTGGSMKSQEELDKDRQLALYSIAIKQNHNNPEVRLIWHFLDFNEKRVSKRTDEELENLRKEIIELINKIESTIDFPANPTCLCKWCEFRGYCIEGMGFESNKYDYYS
ncbi:MAG: PD-(D/E)XK nuclease family protein [Nanoarchaeota archaeon]|nr:PD-(D/E)XK nuclease family protein [Nanoarchaeota archaeon]